MSSVCCFEPCIVIIFPVTLYGSWSIVFLPWLWTIFCLFELQYSPCWVWSCNTLADNSFQRQCVASADICYIEQTEWYVHGWLMIALLLVSGSTMCTHHSPSWHQWDALTSFMDSVMMKVLVIDDSLNRKALELLHSALDADIKVSRHSDYQKMMWESSNVILWEVHGKSGFI